MLRRILGWIVLVPLSLVLILFALANRQLTVVNFNPLVPPEALSGAGFGVPLFLVIFCMLLIGVVLGGLAAWLAQGPVRRERRQLQRDAERLSRELETQRRSRGSARGGQSLIDADDLVDSN